MRLVMHPMQRNLFTAAIKYILFSRIQEYEWRKNEVDTKSHLFYFSWRFFPLSHFFFFWFLLFLFLFNTIEMEVIYAMWMSMWMWALECCHTKKLTKKINKTHVKMLDVCVRVFIARDSLPVAIDSLSRITSCGKWLILYSPRLPSM